MGVATNGESKYTTRTMKRSRADLIAVTVLVLVVLVFFARIFFPVPQMLVTPDYGRSDAWHFSFPTKFALSESLSKLSLPLWRDDIGGGFPLYAEGQTGALFLPNILYFLFFSPVIAYNLALVTAVLFIGIGTYALIRILGRSITASWMAAITLTFSALTVTQLTHITLLQGMSMLPLIAYLSVYAVKNQRPVPFGGVAFAVAQQIFAGFPQATFLTLLFTGSLMLITLLPKRNFTSLGAWAMAVLLGIGMGAIQLYPSYEFLTASTDPSGFSPRVATAYSMPIKHLMSFIDPFFFGSPENGSYPPFYQFDGSIFWENTAYIGTLPLLLLLGGAFLLKKHRTLLFWYALLIGALFLAAGKYAPTYVIYSVWPMTLFRVASRFLWLVILAIVVIAAISLDVIRQRPGFKNSIRILIYFLLVAHTMQLVGTWWSYHRYAPASEVLKQPVTARQLIPGRTLTLGEGKVHNEEMIRNGWQNPEVYAFLRQGMSPDSNMLWRVPQAEVYAGRFLKRPSITQGMISDEILVSPPIATVSATNVMSTFHIGNILSFLPLDAPMLQEKQTYRHGDRTLTHYVNNDMLPRAYLVRHALRATTLVEAVSLMTGETFIPGTTVLLEAHSFEKFPSLAAFADNKTAAYQRAGSVEWQEIRDTAIRLRVTSEENALLVLADTYYPGWKAFIDGTETPIVPANLSQRAIIVPAGTHTVLFRYQPDSIVIGGIVSGVFFLLTVSLMAVRLPVSVSHIRKKSPAHALHRPYTRRRR